MNPQVEAEVVEETTKLMGCNQSDVPKNISEFYDRLRLDGSLGPKPVHPNQAFLAKQQARRKAKQKAAKAARKRNRR